MKIKLHRLPPGKSLISDSADPATLGLPPDFFNHPIRVEIELEDLGNLINADYSFKTSCAALCDRCAREFNLELESQGRLFFMTGSGKEPAPDENLKLFHHDHPEVDITQDILDAMALAIPAKILCRQDCKGLCPQCGTDLNSQSCSCSAAPVDSRWEKLRELKKNLSEK